MIRDDERRARAAAPRPAVEGLDYDVIAEEYGRHRRVHPGVLRDLVSAGPVGTK
jgi:hypothetical protein